MVNQIILEYVNYLLQKFNYHQSNQIRVNISLKHFKFNGFERTSLIPAFKQFSISYELVNAVRPII